MKRTDPLVRFWAKVDQTDGCWYWTAGRDRDGYGRFRPGGMAPDTRAHRWSYTQFVGPIPDGMQIDHVCHDPATCGGSSCPHRGCVNPAHLRAVPLTVNTSPERSATNRLRSEITHCPQGHEYTPENTYIQKKGSRACRKCARISHSEWRKRKGRK